MLVTIDSTLFSIPATYSGILSILASYLFIVLFCIRFVESIYKCDLLGRNFLSAISRFFGCKWSLVIGYGLFSPFIISIMFELPDFVPISTILMFVGLSIVFNSKSIYLTAIGETYANVARQPRDLSILKVYAISYSLITISGLFGTLIIASGMNWLIPAKIVT